MNQTPFHVPPEFLGIPTLGFGWALIIWIAVGLLLAVFADEEHGFGQSILRALPVLLVGAAIIVWVLPRIEELDAGGQSLGLPIRGYGLAMFFAVTSGVGLALHRARKIGIPADLVYGLAMWMFLLGFAGARLFFLIQYRDRFQADSWLGFLSEAVNITQGGLVVYGSLIGGLLAYTAYVWRHRLPPLAIGDLLAPSMLLGLAIGRIGCLMNGCCYGGACEHPWAVEFPKDSIPYAAQREAGLYYGFQLTSREGNVVVQYVLPGGPAAEAGLKPGDVLKSFAGRDIQVANGESLPVWLTETLFAPAGTPVLVETGDGRQIRWTVSSRPAGSFPVHPAQIYSTINALAIFFVIMALAPLVRRDGILLAATLTIYPVTRFMLEIIRTDEPAANRLDMTVSQTFSLLVIVLAGVLWFWLLKRPLGRAQVAPSTSSITTD